MSDQPTARTADVPPPPNPQRRRWLGVLPLAASLAAGTVLPAVRAFAGERHGGDSRGGDDDRRDEGGAVFTLTNAPEGNAVIVYARGADGVLAPAGQFSTDGAGTGAGLGSQGAVIVSEDRRFLFAVNAGSHTIASFRLRRGGLEPAGVVPSGGTMPTSLTYRHGLLYVLNAGVPNNVTGFRVSPRGRLTLLEGSSRPLRAASTSPAQAGFSRDGDVLIVTERATNLIGTYPVNRDGTLQSGITHPSAGPTPFGFAVGLRNTLLVSEAGAGGGASTYRIGDDGLQAVSGMIMTGQRAACWAAITPDGKFGYVTNAGTGNISGLAIARDRSAVLLDPDGVTAVTGGNPTDVAMSQDGRYLYARVSALGRIAVFRIMPDGSLWTLPPLAGTPTTLAGLAGY